MKDTEGNQNIDTLDQLSRMHAESWSSKEQLSKSGTGLRTNPRGIPFLVVPDGDTFKTIALKDFEGPQFKGTITIKDAGHFIEAVNRFKIPASRIFLDQKAARITALIDYHNETPKNELEAAAQAGENRFVIALDLSPSPELEAFLKLHNAGGTSQEGMSEFLLDWGYCCTKPGEADMEQLARELQVRKGVDFKRAQNIANGEVQLTYKEELSASTSGTMDIPTKLKLTMPLWLGAEPTEFDAQFRYRLVDGKLTLGIRLVRLLIEQRKAMLAIAKRIAAETGIPVWEGAAQGN